MMWYFNGWQDKVVLLRVYSKRRCCCGRSNNWVTHREVSARYAAVAILFQRIPQLHLFLFAHEARLMELLASVAASEKLDVRVLDTRSKAESDYAKYDNFILGLGAGCLTGVEHLTKLAAVEDRTHLEGIGWVVE